MFNRYYQEELTYLRDLAKEFSRNHPALAPMLSGPSSDPDVERLLEGVAFSTAMLREKLDDEFPEIVHGLTDIIFPHYLRPIPSVSIVSFFPKQGLSEPVTVPPGTTLDSIPVDGTACRFKTCSEVTVAPLEVADARLVEQPGRAIHIRVSINLTSGDLASWKPSALTFFLGAGIADAGNLYLLFNRHLDRVVLQPRQGGREHALPVEWLAPAGFDEAEALIPFPRRTFAGYRLLQEYFLLPRKFLFMALRGCHTWPDPGTGTAFDIIFEFRDPPFEPPQVRAEDFVLHATPVINIFNHPAKPVDLDHKRATIPVKPSGDAPDHFQVYAIEKVVGIVHGTAQQKEYIAFDRFQKTDQGAPVYQVLHRPSVTGRSVDVSLTLPYAGGAEAPTTETLSIALSCTNGSLVESLQLGDICQPTEATPIGVDFRNILPPTAPVIPGVGGDALWRFLSHVSLNLLSIVSTESLKELLGLYIYPEGRDRGKIAANQKRISSIQSVISQGDERVIAGHMMRGWKVHLEIRQDGFASPGDMYLFCTIIDRFLSMYAGLNTYTRLSVRDTITGDDYLWPPRIGERHLL